MQTTKYTYTVWKLNGIIQRYPKGSKVSDAYLLNHDGTWCINITSYPDNDTPNQRPISPLAVAHFIAVGGYNCEYFKQH